MHEVPGPPAMASAEAGAFFIQQAIDEISETARGVLFEGAPGPSAVMGWLGALTLGGRLAPPVPKVRVLEV